MTNFLEKLQENIELHLNSHKSFQSIPVLRHQQSNFESCLNEFVQTGVGLCIVILNPIPIRIIPGKDRVTFEEILLRIQVIENYCTNDISISSLSVAEEISRCLHHYHPSLTGWQGWLVLSEKFPWKEIIDEQKNNRYILEINFQVRGSTINLH